MTKFDEIKELVEAIQQDADKFYQGGNKAAGTRVRKAMSKLGVLTKETRAEIQSIKNQGA